MFSAKLTLPHKSLLTCYQISDKSAGSVRARLITEYEQFPDCET